MTEFVSNKFDLNLLAASNNKEDLIEAKKEWGHIGHEKSDQKKTCICNHKILNVEYFLNLQNGSIICCGSVCCKKFNFDTKKEIDNHLLKEILRLRKPYDNIDYKQFATIQEYLDYARDELAKLMAKKIESAKFANLNLMLENIMSIKTSFGVDTFDTYIDSVKAKIVELIPSYVEAEMSKDVSSIFEQITKLGKMSADYGVEKTSPEIFKTAISNIVDYYVSERGYSGDTTVPFQAKIDKILLKIEAIKRVHNKNMFLKDFFIEMNEKLKKKIQSIRDANFARDKAAYEKRQKYLAWKHRNGPV
jgi:hypothetical protein